MIYLDHNATTPVLPEVVEAMLPWLRENWGNPSSIYASGQRARRAVEEARAKVATFLGAEPEQVIFTSGATESNNAAIHSALLQQPGKRHIVVSQVEHSAVLAFCEHLERHWGAEVTRLPVDAAGMLVESDLRAAIRPDTALVSLMWANNETGVVWPIAEIAKVCVEMGVPLHTDAVQAVGKLPVNFCQSGASFLSLSGHKFGAPKGIGALIVADPGAFVPMVVGGKQESSLRGGTENVPGIVGIGAAAEVANGRGNGEWAHVRRLRDALEVEVFSALDNASINGNGSPRLPNTSNIYIPGMDADALVTFLDQQGICVSSGSACLESAIAPSHVVMAMTGSHDRASESFRVSLGLDSKPEEIESLVAALKIFERAFV